MKAVCNTSPLLFLSKIDSLHLLTDCFTNIYVPEGVITEAQNLPLPANIICQPPSQMGIGFVQGAIGTLHQSKLEAIHLTQEINADYVLLDDLAVRHKAQRMGLNVIGTVGVLLLACRTHHLSTTTALESLDTLIQHHNLYLSATIRAEFEAALRKI